MEREDLVQIVDLQMAGLNRMLEDKRLQIELTHAAREYMAEVGYEPAFGARPLRRAIQKHVQDPLALQLLDGTLKEGDRILVDRDENGLTFNKKELAVA